MNKFLKPSVHSKIFVAEVDDFGRWRRELAVCGKQASTILTLTMIFNIKHVRSSFSSLTRAEQIFVAATKIVLHALGFIA